MIDAMPLWFWLPAALLLWGYLAADALVRWRNRMESTMPQRTIVIARSKEEGKRRFPNAVAVITPKSPDGARGVEADRVVVLRSMDNHPRVLELREAALPSLATTGGSVEGEPETPAVPTHVEGEQTPPAGTPVPTHTPGPASIPPLV
uniref:hypothetical protein n=1 Tax=Microbacterium proteolyticum TaxID=1572644 RepID=UPI002416D4B2|nr:hypothetical protein [Microbacterium proteolyticum]